MPVSNMQLKLHCTTHHGTSFDLACLQLSERRAGNAAYKQHQHQQALYHYERALSIVEFVGGSNTDDQAEIDANKVAVLLNMAAGMPDVNHVMSSLWLMFGLAITCYSVNVPGTVVFISHIILLLNLQLDGVIATVQCVVGLHVL